MREKEAVHNLHTYTTEPVLAEVLRDYLAANTLKLRTKNSYEAVIRRCYSDWLYRPITSIKRYDVQEKHREISLSGKYQANLAGRILRALFTFAEYRYTDDQGEPLIQTNPTKVLTALNLWHPEKRRQRRVMPDEMPKWWSAVLSMENRTASDWLIVLLLSGMRRNEVTNLTYGDLDLNKGIITVRDTKSNRPLVYPMSDLLWALFKSRYVCAGFPPVSAPVFASQDGLSPMSRWDRSYDWVASVTGIRFSPHDLRRSWQSTATESNVHVYSLKRLMGHSFDTGDWTIGYYVQDIEHLRGCVQQVTDAIVKQAGLEKSQLLRRWTELAR